MGNQTTPLAVDQYGRFMATVFDDRKIIGVPTAGQAFFGNPASGGVTLYSPDSNVVDIDIIRGNERLAALVQRGTVSRPVAGQKNTSDQKFTTLTRQYPLIEEEGDLNANQLNFRVAGENPYMSMTKLDRLRMLGRDAHMEHVRRIVRLYEYLCWQSLLTGQMPAIFGTTNADLIYSFYRRAAHIITVAALWSNVATDIMGDLDTACELIRANGHVNPDMAIIGGDAMSGLINNTAIKALADNRRFELIEVGTGNPVPEKFMRFVNAGLTPRGRLRTAKGYELWLFTYVDTYQNAAGTATKYMPEGSALITSSSARMDRYFGPSEVLPMTPSRAGWYQETFGFNPLAAPMPPGIKDSGNAINPAMFYFDAYASANAKSLTIRTQSAPIFATTQTDAIVTLNGLV